MIYTVPVYFLMMVSFETGSDASEYIGRNDGAKGCTRRQIFPHRRGILSDVETEVHDVAILHDVFLTLDAEFTGFLYSLLSPRPT